MGFLGSLFGKEESKPEPNAIRETLFGDMPLEAWPGLTANSYTFPWKAFAEARSFLSAGNREAAVVAWEKILLQTGLESRHYLQAWNFLRQNGRQPDAATAKQVLGVVVEVAMPGGLDLLAAYADHSARYYNYAGGGVVWEHPDQSLDTNIDELLAASRQIVEKIGPWEQSRPGPPIRPQARLSFLTPSGLHFGQAPMAVLSHDPMAGKVLAAATTLMQRLIAKTKTST